MDLSDYLSVAAILVSVALVAVILLQVKGEGVGGLQSGSFVRTRRGSFGIGISWAEPEAVDVAGFAGSVTLRESRAVPSPAQSEPPAASPTDTPTAGPP